MVQWAGMSAEPLLAAPSPAETDGTSSRCPLTVSQLTQLIEGTLETMFQSVWVSGEISEISRPHSGHLYFTLQDEGAQLRSVVWRSTAERLRYRLEEGQRVLCLGNLDVYPARGIYQLNVRQVEPQGEGTLQLALKQLQQRLAAEGLFDSRHKQALPAFPRRVGFVTSPSGAAIRDFLEVSARRFRGVDVLVIPARVQGEGAGQDIARGIEAANRIRPSLDVLIVGRGGGSVEDLWCFNQEEVVRAIFASRLPVVSAVGHEIDVTLSDLAADVRALTPSEAAERVIPSAEDLNQRLSAIGSRLRAILRARVAHAKSRLDLLARSRVLRHPESLVNDRARRLDELDEQLAKAFRRQLDRRRQLLSTMASRLNALSPLAVLARGYSVTTANSGAALLSSENVQIGDIIRSRLRTGEIVSRVESRES